MQFRFENKEFLPLVETVRVALFYRGKFLVLQKSDDSKNPEAFEFPGGKIDQINDAKSTIAEQQNAVDLEVLEETHIDITFLPKQKIEDFQIYFEVNKKDGTKIPYKRLVHLFLVRIPDSMEISIKVDHTIDENGVSEDKHKGCVWVTREELINSTTNLQKNHSIDKHVYPLARNSRHIKKLLEVVL